MRARYAEAGWVWRDARGASCGGGVSCVTGCSMSRRGESRAHCTWIHFPFFLPRHLQARALKRRDTEASLIRTLEALVGYVRYPGASIPSHILVYFRVPKTSPRMMNCAFVSRNGWTIRYLHLVCRFLNTISRLGRLFLEKSISRIPNGLAEKLPYDVDELYLKIHLFACSEWGERDRV